MRPQAVLGDKLRPLRQFHFGIARATNWIVHQLSLINITSGWWGVQFTVHPVFCFRPTDYFVMVN